MRVFLLIIAIVFTISSQAQDEYVVVSEDDNIIISYQVLEVKKKGALIPELRISIKNKGVTYVEAGFEINLRYDMEFVEGTMVADMCVAPGKTKKGKIKGLFYNPEGLSYAQMMSDDFEILIEEIVVVEIQKCK